MSDFYPPMDPNPEKDNTQPMDANPIPEASPSYDPAPVTPEPEPFPVQVPLPPQPEPAASSVSSSSVTPTSAPAPTYTPPAYTPPQPLSPEDERTWAMLAHLSVLVNLFTGFLGPVVALVIYLVFKDRSKYVANQSMQSFIFQLLTWIGGGILAAIAWTIAGVLTVVLVGLCLMPIAFLISLIPLAALVYGIYAAIETSQGKDFKYWLVGDWVKDMHI